MHNLFPVGTVRSSQCSALERRCSSNIPEEAGGRPASRSTVDPRRPLMMSPVTTRLRVTSPEGSTFIRSSMTDWWTDWGSCQRPTPGAKESRWVLSNTYGDALGRVEAACTEFDSRKQRRWSVFKRRFQEVAAGKWFCFQSLLYSVYCCCFLRTQK